MFGGALTISISRYLRPLNTEVLTQRTINEHTRLLEYPIKPTSTSQPSCLTNPSAQKCQASTPNPLQHSLPPPHPTTIPPTTTNLIIPGDSKSTADKLTDTATSVGQNIVDTGKHYADKTGATDTTEQIKSKTESAGQNVADTAAHYADKGNPETGGGVGQEKTLLEQAGDMAAQAVEVVQKAATGEFSSCYRDMCW